MGAAAARISPSLASPELGSTGPDSRDSRGSTSGRRASASRPVDARMRSGSLSSAAMDQGSILENQLRRGSVRSSMAGGALTQRFADIVRQATKPAWLSGGDAAPARSAPSPEFSRQMYKPQPPSAAQGAAQDLVAMINASLSSQAAAPQGIPSPGTPVRQERRSSMVNSAKSSPRVQSRLAAGSAGPGSAELAEIEALLSPQVNAQDKPMHPLQQADGGLLNSASTGQSRRPEPTTDSYVRGSNVEGITDGVHHLSMPAFPAQARSNYDDMQWGKDALIESRALPEAHQHARRAPVSGPAAEQSAMHVPTIWQSPEAVYGGEASARPALQYAERPLQKPVSKLLQRSYIEPATLADLRTKWLQKPGIPTDLFSTVGLRCDSRRQTVGHSKQSVWNRLVDLPTTWDFRYSSMSHANSIFFTAVQI